MKKAIFFAITFSVGLAVGLILAYGPLNAQDAGNEPEVISKLDSIAKSQQEIVEAINSIKQDIQIIKIRITQNL